MFLTMRKLFIMYICCIFINSICYTQTYKFDTTGIKLNVDQRRSIIINFENREVESRNIYIDTISAYLYIIEDELDDSDKIYLTKYLNELIFSDDSESIMKFDSNPHCLICFNLIYDLSRYDSDKKILQIKYSFGSDLLDSIYHNIIWEDEYNGIIIEDPELYEMYLYAPEFLKEKLQNTILKDSLSYFQKIELSGYLYQLGVPEYLINLVCGVNISRSTNSNIQDLLKEIGLNKSILEICEDNN